MAALKREVLARCVVDRSEAAAAAEEARYDLILVSSGAILCDRDTVQDVLQDGDTLSLRELLANILIPVKPAKLGSSSR